MRPFSSTFKFEKKCACFSHSYTQVLIIMMPATNPEWVYHTDEQVIGLITQGLGQGKADPVELKQCTWLEMVED